MTLTRDRIVSSALSPARPARVRLVAVIVGAIGALVSVLGSWIPSFWGDEAASVLSASRSIPSLFTMLGNVDAVHGTYYLGLHFWIMAFGSSPLSVRLPSALAIGACVAGVVLLGAKIDSLKLGMVAGVICTVLPRVTGMGDEARSYAFTAAIATWLTVLFLSILRRDRPGRRQWIAYGALLAVGAYVFLYLVLIAAAHAVVLLLDPRTRPLLRRWFVTMLAVVATISPLLFFAIAERGQVAFLGHRPTTDFYSLTVSLWFGAPIFAVMAWALIAAAIGYFASDLRVRRRAGLAVPDLALSPVAVAGAWLFVPSLLLLASHILVPDFTARYLSMCAPAAALLMSVGMLRLARRRSLVIATACAIIVGVAVPGFVKQRGEYGKNSSDWAGISETIAANAKAGDAIAFDDANRPSRRTRLALNTYPAGFAGLDDVMLRSPYYATNTWYDSTWSMADTISLGRLTGVNTLWLVEYRTPTHTDTSGIRDLAALGFIHAKSIGTHRSVILEFTR